MATKKKRPKQIRQIQPAELIKLAEDHLNRGQIDEAIQNLRLVEKEVQPRVTADGKKISTPPHLVAVQTATPPLLARAFSARSLNVADPKQKLADLEMAVKYAPEEIRYRIATGACRILLGQSEAARSDFEKAEESRPGDAFATRAFTLGLLATGHAREAGDLLNQWPEDRRNESWRRLVALQRLSGGEVRDQLWEPRDGDRLLSGLSHLARGENDRARETLAAPPAMDHNPSRAEAAQIATQFFYNGWLSFNTRHYQAAIASWREANRLSQTHQLRLPWRDRLAIIYHKIAENVLEENLSLAVECWQEALKLSPNDKTAQANLAATRQALATEAWREGKIEQAVALWIELLKDDPLNERLSRNLAVGCERLGRKTEALTHWRALARVWRRQAKQRSGEPGFKESLLKVEERAVNLMLEVGMDGQEIVNELEAALKFDPDNLDLRKRMVEQLLEIGKPQVAMKHLDAMERQGGVSADLLTQKGMALDMMGRHADARKIFEQAAALDPSDAVTRRNFLIFLTQEAIRADKRHDKKRVMEICEQQLSLDRNYEPALAFLASIYLASKRKADAKDLLERLIATDPKSPQKRAFVGSIYLRHKMRKEAEAMFKEATDLESSPECFFFIGLSYLEVKEVKQALKYFDSVAEKGDSDMLIEIATRLMDAGYPKEIDRYLNKAIELDPSHPMPHVIKAISRLLNPIALLLEPNGMKNSLKELEEAERLAAGNEEYKDLASELNQIRRHLEEAPPGIADLIGGGASPFLFDDDDDDIFIERRKRSRKKRSRR
ncbi:MAG: tetratricopeptide repeat protein [Blastocatellia bacterium]